MYIVAIAWLYVIGLMSLTAKSFLGGLMMFLGWGILPLALFLWLMGTPYRRRLRQAADQKLGKPDGADSQSD